MNLSAPKMVTWAVALILGLIGLVAFLVPIAGVSPLAFWLVLIGLIILLIGTSVEGL
jgi:hypothetical protein